MKVWAYIHPKQNILCCALIQNAVPEGIEAIELEVESPDDVILDGDQIRVKTEEEKANDLKPQIKELIHEKRKEKEDNGIIVLGAGGVNQYQVDTSPKGRSNLQAVLQSYQTGLLNQATDMVSWRFRDGTFVNLSYNQLMEMAGFIFDYVEKLFQVEASHYQTIDSLTTVEQVVNYNIENWPDNQYQSTLIP